MNSNRALTWSWKSSAVTGMLANQWPRIGLAAILLLYLGSFFYWHSLEGTPVLYDQSLYYLKSMAFYSQIRAGDFAGLLRDLQSGMNLSIMPVRPVLIPLLTSITYLLFGPSPVTAQLTIVLFSLLLLGLCYLIGKDWLGWQQGVLGSFIVLMLPAVAIITRHYYLEVPLAAICALTAYLLLRDDVLTTRLGATMLGLTAGLGMWIRETYLFFMIGPIIGFLLYSIFSTGDEKALRRLKLWNFGYAAGVGALISIPFYLPKVQIGIDFLVKLLTKGPGKVDFFTRLTAYYYMFAQLGASLFLLLLFLLCCAIAGIYLLRRRGRAQRHPGFWRGFVVITPWIAVPLAIAPLSSAVDTRYIIPALPAFGILTGAAILGLRPRILRNAVVLSAIIIGLAQFGAMGFAGNSPRLNLFNSISDVYAFYSTHVSSQIDIRNYGFQLDGLAAPVESDWQRTNVIDAIESRRAAAGLTAARVFIVPVTNEEYYLQFMAESAFRSLPLTFYGTDGSSLQGLEDLAQQCDFIVVKDGPPYGAPYGTPFGAQSEEIMKAMQGWPFKPTSDSFLLPDGTHLVVYERVGN